MRLEQILPEFDKCEVHETEIAASPSEVYTAVWKMDLSQSKIIRGLFKLRGMPEGGLTLPGLIELGFNVLEDDKENEIVFGLIGSFWSGKPVMEEHDTNSFKEFTTPGNAKAAWNFLIEPMAERRVKLRTETRVKCTDKKSRFIFSLYWFIIRPFSGWIRRIMLKIIKRNAEASQT